MLVSHKHNFIYTKTVKTAGSTVEAYFEKYCREDNKKVLTLNDQQVSETGIVGFKGRRKRRNIQWYHHMPAEKIKKQLGNNVWDSYFKFTVVRNPFDQLVSYYFFRRNSLLGSTTPQQLKVFFWELKHIGKTKRKKLIEGFRSWVKHYKNRKIIDDAPKYVINDEVVMDYFIRYENLQSGINEVCNKLKLNYRPDLIGNQKSGIRDNSIDLHEFYDQSTIDWVKSLYTFELSYFGYSDPKL